MSERNQTWIDDALCAQTDAEAFHPSRGESTKAAKAVCERCVVISDCLEHAINHPEDTGVRGGKSDRELAKLRKARSNG